MASAYPLTTKRDYGDKTRIDMNQSYQVAYWKERFGVTEQELGEGVRAAGALARKVETYLNLSATPPSDTRGAIPNCYITKPPSRALTSHTVARLPEKLQE